MRFNSTIFLLMFTVMSHATVYKWIDKDGNIHYSDKSISNSEAYSASIRLADPATINLAG